MPKPIISILWIDDEVRVLNIMIDDLKEQFKDEFELVVTQVEDPSTITHTDFSSYDIILTDYHLQDTDQNGLTILNVIRESLCIADVILYSEVEDILVLDGVKAFNHCAFIRSIHGRDKLRDELPPIIQSSVKKIQDIFILRGIVLGDSINLEMKLNEFILTYYGIPEDMKDKFQSQILENRDLSMGAKTSFLIEIEKALPREDPMIALLKPLVKDLPDIMRSRNKFAHHRIEGDQLKSGRDVTSIGRDDILTLRKTIKQNVIRVEQLTAQIRAKLSLSAAPVATPVSAATNSLKKRS